MTKKAVLLFDEAILKEMQEILSSESNEVLEELVNIYTESSNDTVIKIQQAFQRKDRNHLLQLLHSLKSSSGQMGLQRLQHLCESFELSSLDTFSLGNEELISFQKCYTESIKALKNSSLLKKETDHGIL